MSRNSLSNKTSATPEGGVRQSTGAAGFLSTYVLVVILLVAYFVMALSSVVNKCTTFDEIIHLTPGYNCWLNDDYRLLPEGGNLGQRWFALPYNLGNFLRRLALPKSIKDWSLRTMREKLVTIGGKVISHARYVTFQMAEVLISRSLFYELLERIHRLKPVPVGSG